MARRSYSLQHDKERYYLKSGSHSWDEILDLVLTLEKHVDLQINQLQLPSIPDYFEERMGDDDGQDVNYGYEEEDERSIHLKVYDDDEVYRIHWDAKDPNSNPIGHLIHDAPHWAAIIGGAALLGGYALYKKYKSNQNNSI